MRPDANKTQLPPRQAAILEVAKLGIGDVDDIRHALKHHSSDEDGCTIVTVEIMERALKAEAENESLKAELREMTKNRDQWERNSAAENKRAGDALVKVARLEAERDKYKNKADQLRIAFVLSDVILPAEFESTLPPTKRLHAYVDKMLEVIREYRELPTHDHRRCHEHVYYAGLGYKDDRCSTCIKADELLSQEPKEV